MAKRLRRWIHVGVAVAIGAISLANVFIASVAVLELLFFLWAPQPIVTFVRAIGGLHPDDA